MAFWPKAIFTWSLRHCPNEYGLRSNRNILQAVKNGTFLFNGKPQATVFSVVAWLRKAVACGLPLNEAFATARCIENAKEFQGVALGYGEERPLA